MAARTVNASHFSGRLHPDMLSPPDARPVVRCSVSRPHSRESIVTNQAGQTLLNRMGGAAVLRMPGLIPETPDCGERHMPLNGVTIRAARIAVAVSMPEMCVRSRRAAMQPVARGRDQHVCERYLTAVRESCRRPGPFVREAVWLCLVHVRFLSLTLTYTWPAMNRANRMPSPARAASLLRSTSGIVKLTFPADARCHLFGGVASRTMALSVP